MKTKIKVIALILIFAILCVSLCSCEVLKLVNNILPFFHPEDSSDTNIYIDISEIFKCKHEPVMYETKDPTCVASGFVGGYYCSKCGQQIDPPVEIPPQHKYDSNTDVICSVCGFERPAVCDHVETRILESTPSTCSSYGHTAAQQCVKCLKILSGYEKLELLDHTYTDRDDADCDKCGYVRKLECLHTFNIQLQPKEATCQSSGLTSGWCCKDCGKIFLAQTEIPAIDHTESDWIVDQAPTESKKGKAHSECTICGIVLKTKELDAIVPGIDEKATPGLLFALNQDGNSYVVTGINSNTATEIIIPKYHKGKLVTKIVDAAFMGNKNITDVTISEGVLTIGNSAFKNCTSLKAVNIPGTVTKIGEYAFYDCALTSVTLPSGLEKIEAYSFYRCSQLSEIEIPDSVTSIGEGAFAECTLAEKLSLSASLKTIGERAFYNLKKLEYVGLTTTVETIGANAFDVDGSLEIERTIKIYKGITKIGAYAFATGTSINYTGTSNDWNKILIDPRNYQYSVTTSNGSFVD